MYERTNPENNKSDIKSQNQVPYIRRKIESCKSIKSPIDSILFLQRTIGNHAVERLARSGSLHAKLKVGQQGDEYEQEADRIADAVMQMPAYKIVQAGNLYLQKACPKCEENELKRKPIKEEEDEENLRRQKIKEEDEDKLQAKSTSDFTSHLDGIENHIQSMKGRGNPLSEEERTIFEPRFGADFSQVRLHTDTNAAQVARLVNARAFTTGRDIVFGEGQYAPETTTGQRLLAHELTHVVQQRNGRLGNNSKAYQEEMFGYKPVQINNESLASKIQREGGQTSTRFIMAIFVDLTNQTVSWIYSDGMISETYECSTGAGLCNSDCNSPNRGGSACTPVGGPFRVCRPPRTHSSYQYWVEFDCNRKIAFHYYPDVDGCPWSHGCVRLHSDAIRLIYEGSVKDRTLVYVNGTPNLRRCWTSSTAGRCWVRGTGRTRRCKRNDCLEMGDFPIPDTSETATRYA